MKFDKSNTEFLLFISKNKGWSYRFHCYGRALGRGLFVLRQKEMWLSKAYQDSDINLKFCYSKYGHQDFEQRDDYIRMLNKLEDTYGK